MIVADTDVLIDYLEGRRPEAQAVAAALAAGRLQTTVISHFELSSGARQARQRKAVHTLLESIPALPLDRNAAQKAAEVRLELERSGIGIGMADSLIAGIVLLHGARLLTRNRRHFERVPRLPLVDSSVI
jgi:predicted nucleic acid-binding protein